MKMRIVQGARLVRLIRRVASVRMHVMSGCCVACSSESKRDGVVYGVRGRLIGAAAWSPLAVLRLPSMMKPVYMDRLQRTLGFSLLMRMPICNDCVREVKVVAVL